MLQATEWPGELGFCERARTYLPSPMIANVLYQTLASLAIPHPGWAFFAHLFHQAVGSIRQRWPTACGGKVGSVA